MYAVENIKNKKYHLYSIQKGKYDGYFYNYTHVLWYFKNYDLSDLAHNRNDINKETNYRYIQYQDRYVRWNETITPKQYIVLDSTLTVVHKDQLAKDIKTYQRIYPNPYRAIKRGTNKKRAYNGFRHSARYYKNVVAYLISEKDQFPLNKREASLKDRLYWWDNDMRSNKGDNWKLQKKRRQWDKKC